MTRAMAAATPRALSLLLLVACASPGLSRIPLKLEAGEPPNIVLIVLDTVRADHLSCYGYERPTTPAIDALARYATRYENAISTAPWTLPSHASMFTGLAPHEHGAHGFLPEGPNQNDVTPLREDLPVLAEVLKEQGYATAAFSANNVFLTRRWGLARGFDTYEVRHRYADAHNREVIGWLDEHAAGPFFLFVNYIDAHRPYNVRHRPGFLTSPPNGNGRLIDRLRRQVMGTDDPIPEDLRAQVIDQYDNAIAHMDDAVGDLLLELDRRGLRERTIVVVTSDHGEYFGEHRLVEHNMDVYQPGVHVPLIVYTPGQTPEVDAEVVTSQDMAFLLAERVGTKDVRVALTALSRGPGTHPALAENYYSRPWDVFSEIWGHRFQRIRRALYEWPNKVIHATDGTQELYDLERDPDEARDLGPQLPGVTQRMASAIDREAARSAAQDRADTPEVQLTDEEVAQMRALGYVE
jgi:arylsulfatase A-like enzyme